MPDYDPTTVDLVSAMLKALDPQDGDEALSYEETLRRVQTALMMTLQEGDAEPDPEDEQVLRQALGYLDPKNEDRYAGYGEVLRRLLSAIDRQLFIWTSDLVQPPGPSGDFQVAVFDPEAV
jgi:hypothetical protein